MFCRNSKAFTLIELLVVISIIALLLSIIMPALQIAKQKASGAVCLSNLKNMGLAWYAYTSENDSKMVSPFTGYSSENWVNAPLTDDGDRVSFQDSTIDQKINGIMKGALYSYLKAPKVYHCPGDRRSKGKSSSGTGDGGYRSYSIPDSMNGREDVRKITQLRMTDSKYVFVEESDKRGGNLGTWGFKYKQSIWWDPLAIWHNDSSTLSFADGHAESHKWKGEGTLRMSENSIFNFKPQSEADWEDYRYMDRGYARPGNL